MASHWAYSKFWDNTGSNEGVESGDEVEGRKKANIPGKQSDSARARRISREAAFVAAFEETDVERLGHSSNEDESPFEGFLVAAFSTLLALLLAWRFLAWNPENGRDESKVATTRLGEHHDSARNESQSPPRQLTSSPDSSDSSGGGGWCWFQSGDTSSSSSSCPQSKTTSSQGRKQRKKRRQFDEKYAPKRRLLSTSVFEKREQLCASTSESREASHARPLLVDSTPSSPPIELEQRESSSNNSLSRRNNVAVEWPSTADEATERDFAIRTTSSPTMEANLRRLQSQWTGKQDLEDDDAIGMVSTPLATSHDHVEMVPSEKTTVQSASVGSCYSSTRRPLVSPPPPPPSRDHPVFLISTNPRSHAHQNMSQEQSTSFCTSHTSFHDNEEDLDVEDFIGSDLPPGFVSTVTDDISRSANLLLEELSQAEILLSSRHGADIVRDLDTITEVSETDDLTSLSSNGCVNESRNAQSISHDANRAWSRSSTAPCKESPKTDSDCYRQAPTVTACSSSSETANDYEGAEVYVDGEPATETPTPPSVHEAQTSSSPSTSRKIDHVSRNSVIKGKHEKNAIEGQASFAQVEEKRTPCLPEENTNQSQLERGAVVAEGTGPKNAALASGTDIDRHESGSASLLPAKSRAADEAEFCEHETPQSSFVDELHERNEIPNSKDNGLEREFLSPTSSGRTSIASDLPDDGKEPLASEIEIWTNDPNCPLRSPSQHVFEVHDTPPAFEELLRESTRETKGGHAEPRLSSFSIRNEEIASGVETGSPNPVSNIIPSTEERPIIDADATSLAPVIGGKNTSDDSKSLAFSTDRHFVTFKEDQSSSSSLSSRPRRERRFQLAYQQYHSSEREDAESDSSATSVSNLTSEPTKTTLIKQDNLHQLSCKLSSNVAEADEDSTAPSTCMDRIDLETALKRFARYGELYGDAPRSGMDEFRAQTDEDGFDMSSLDASRGNSLPNGGASAKMEALLKSTLQSKGPQSVNGVANTALSSTPLMKREPFDDSLLSSHCIGGATGGVHALALERQNGGYPTTGTKTMTDGRKEENLINGGRPPAYNDPLVGTRATADANKTNATVTSTILSLGEFRPPSRPQLLSESHDKNRFSLRSSTVDGAGDGASASAATTSNSNYDGVYAPKLKSNPGDAIGKVARERDIDDKRTRPTSAPLTPLLISHSPAPSSLGFGLGFVDAFDQTDEPVCVASATSQAIVNDPESKAFVSKTPKKILAEASANAVGSNPYIALARATTAAASKVAQASNENLLDDGITGTVSLVVSSTVTTTKRDFFSTTKSTPDLLFFASGLEPKNRTEMSRPVEITPTYGVIPRGTASVFQQRHRELSPSRSGALRSPERKRHNYGAEYANGADSKVRSSATTPVREWQESKKVLFASSDHLQKLLEDPYYVKPKEKPEPPKRSPPKETTQTPATSQKSPPRAPLSERNISDWNRRPENSLENQRQQNLLRWTNSMNLAENEELRQAMLEDEKRAKNLSALSSAKTPQDESLESSSFYGAESKRSSSVRATTPVVPELWDYKIFREAQQRADAEVDEETKKTRRNKYKAKIDRAKRDYLTTKASASDLYRSIEDFEKKFNVSMDNVRLPDPPRGPYLEYLSRSGNLHVIDVNELPPPAYVRPKPRFDREYEAIVRKAEESWAAYKKRLYAAASKHGDDLYARSRGFSTGVLETDVDDLSPYQRGQKSIVETDLDKVQKEIEHESRKRSKTPAANGGQDATSRAVHSRAKSADYLMDQRARTEVEPPENQLQKILGDKDEKDLSEHELRFRKSTEKLPVPDWYLNSEYCPGGKVPSPEFSKSRQSGYPTERPTSTQSYRYYEQTWQKTPSSSSYAKSPTPVATTRQEDTSSRYVSPWVTGGRISGPQGMKAPNETPRGQQPSPASRRSTPAKQIESPKIFSRPAEPPKGPQVTRPEPRKATEQIQTISTTTHSISKSLRKEETFTTSPSKPKKEDFILPKHFFDKYKDEIEELRKSRTALNAPILDIDDEATWEEQQRKRLSAQGLPVPIATVRPNQARDEDFDTTASISFSPASSPESRLHPRPGTTTTQYTQSMSQSKIQQSFSTSKPSPAPRSTAANVGPHHEAPLTTSTPYSSELLQRKTQPVSIKETAFEPYRQSPAPKETAFEVYPHQKSHEKAPSSQAHHIIRRPSLQAAEPRYMPGGWTVSAVPPDWNVPGQRDSVVIEVAGDSLFDSGTGATGKGKRLPSHLTLEEILDSMFALPVAGKQTLTTIDESSNSLLDDVLPARPRTPTNLEGPGIYTQNQQLMERCLLEPELAAELLKREALLVKCGYCNRARELEDARRRGFVSCHHCYTYYCNRTCRRADWDRHLDICSYARINTLCKRVILKVRQDPESQFQMSRVAQRGYQGRGRGSVNFRFFTLTMAKNYVKEPGGGWRSLRAPPGDPSDFLRYYTVSDLLDAQKDPSLITLCRRYDPRSKFVLSVSIMADIEECPETPPPELEGAHEATLSSNQDSSWYQRGVGAVPFSSSNGRPQPLSGTEASWMSETRKPAYHSNGVSKDDITSHQSPTQGQYNFSRADQHRHTVAAPQRSTPQYPTRSDHWQDPVSRPGVLIGPEDADETEV